jgi:hypothetical protein
VPKLKTQPQTNLTAVIQTNLTAVIQTNLTAVILSERSESKDLHLLLTRRQSLGAPS